MDVVLQKRIKYFLTCANCMSFTLAAEQMFISQQAMTKQISMLEDDLGVKLFVRSTRSVSLTEAGKVCREEFLRLEDDASAAVRRIRNTALANTSSVTVGFYYFFSREKLITPIMEALYSNFPNVNFKIVLYDFQVMRHSLLDGNCDICFAVSSDWQRWTHITSGVIEKLPFKLFMSSSHPLAGYEELPFEKLCDYDWLLSGNIDVLRPNTPSWYARIPCREKVPIGNFMTVLAYIESGKGFSCQPPVFQGVDSPNLKFYSVPFEDACLDLIYAYSDSMKNPLVLSIARHIKHMFAKKL